MPLMISPQGLKKAICILLVLFTAGFSVFFVHVSDARAQAASNCSLAYPFPVQPEHALGACRGTNCSRRHAGVDVMMATNTSVPIQHGCPAGGCPAGAGGVPCNIMMNGAGNPLWNNPSGLGLYMRFDCGNGIEARYAHLNGYNSTSQLALVGYTGNASADAPHVHYEVLLMPQGAAPSNCNQSRSGGIYVDPQCVMGLQKTTTQLSYSPPCPAGMVGPQNLCDPIVRQAIIQHGCQATGGLRSNQPMQSGAPPGSVPPGRYGDPAASPSTNTDTGEGHFNESTGNVPDGTGLQPGGGANNPPPTPGPSPGPAPAGQDGGAPDLTPPPGPAAAPVVTGCATDTWEAMVSQAVLEARREVVMNQTYIAKPDSVMAYTCFNEQLRSTQERAGPLFSETDKWANMQVDISGTTVQRQVTMTTNLGTTSLDAALNNVVRSAMNTFLALNYNHGRLGETTQAAGTGTSVAGNISTANCSTMNQVWQAAKCHNFETEQIWYTFEELVNTDPRIYPSNMRCGN